jgi:hypothetical protein
MALPKSQETPRGRHLQDILEKAAATDLAGWPMLNEKDYVLVGAFIVLFSYIDLNLRRVIEALARVCSIFGCSEVHGKLVCKSHSAIAVFFRQAGRRSNLRNDGLSCVV